jgi:hypothetical protein
MINLSATGNTLRITVGSDIVTILKPTFNADILDDNIMLSWGGNTMSEPYSDVTINGVAFASVEELYAGIVALLNSNAGGEDYLEFDFVLSQSGTDAPTVSNIFKNTFPGTIIFTRQGTGTYIGTLQRAFPSAETFSKQYLSLGDDLTAEITVNDENSFKIVTKDGGVAADSLLEKHYFEIKVKSA